MEQCNFALCQFCRKCRYCESEFRGEGIRSMDRIMSLLNGPSLKKIVCRMVTNATLGNAASC
jgi:hypothetical protein